MKNFKISYVNVLFNFLVGTILAYILGVTTGLQFNPLLGGVALEVLAVALSIYSLYYGDSFISRTVFTAGLLKEIWIARLMEKFYPTAAWLQRAQDFSAMVENNTINLAEIGADPDVLVNNTTYPVPFADRADVPLQLPLDYYDTKGTVVRNAEAIQLAYNKLDTVIGQHGKALAKAQSAKAAWNFSPTSNTADTPVLKTSGKEGVAYASGVVVPFGFRDIIAAAQSMDDLNLPQEGRVLVLNSKHKADLLKEDINIFKGFVNVGTGMIGQLYGFDIYVSTQTATYNGTTGVKKAYGAAAAGTDVKSSFFFLDTEVMRATGTMDMFSRLKDPEARGDIIGFQQRFVALSLRNKNIGAVIDTVVA
ncbi:hypothetical protein [Mucilaginibacter sp.]|uniref:hypothetical protein n=1 Tax=Mucilaginibacter sp. TaxID=1882438 RepID=UPI000CC41879|nr:hypothetical protein [Mucilaginibacter sp.]PLW89989.1 MAG: hypothetical protein C0154_08680 [Mucilaginibacter sp.]PMP65783.1 MAG: hypothetical protein C0191_02670 [Mucilaginibacter sp.]